MKTRPQIVPRTIRTSQKLWFSSRVTHATYQ